MINPQLLTALVDNAKEIVREFPNETLDECFTILSKCCLDEKFCRKMTTNNSDKEAKAKLRKMTFAQLQEICRLAMRTINAVKQERKTASETI